MKIDGVNNNQVFASKKGRIARIAKQNKEISMPKSLQENAFNEKQEAEIIRMNTKVSAAIAAIMAAGIIGAGATACSMRPDRTERPYIGSDILDGTYEDIPSANVTEKLEIPSQEETKVTTDNKPETEKQPETTQVEEQVKTPATTENVPTDKAEEQKNESEQVVVEHPHESKKEDKKEETKVTENTASTPETEDVEYVNEDEDVEYLEESEVIDESEDAEVIYEPENYPSDNFAGGYFNPDVVLPPQFPPPNIWMPEISDETGNEEVVMQFKSPFNGKDVKEIGRDDIAGSVLFDDGSILVEKSRILYSKNGTFVDFDKYMEEGEGNPVPIQVASYMTDSMYFENIKIEDEEYYPTGMTKDGNVTFNDGSVLEVNTGFVTRTNGSVYHFYTGDMLRGPVNDSEIVVDNDKPRYPYPAFPPFYDPITGEAHKEVERTKTSIIYDDGSVFDIKTGKTTRPDGSVWGNGPVLLQVPEDPSGLAPYKDEEDNVHYAVACDVENNTATFDDESKFYVEAGLLVKADGTYWSWNGCTTTLPERLPQVEPVPGDPLPPPKTEPGL